MGLHRKVSRQVAAGQCDVILFVMFSWAKQIIILSEVV